MTPSTYLVLCTAGLLALGIGAAIWPELTSLWWIAASLLAAFALADLSLVSRLLPPWLTREVAGSLAQGVASTVKLTLGHAGARPLTIEVYDHHPASVECCAFPHTLRLAPKHATQLDYEITPTLRGTHRFARAALRLRSPLRLWWRGWRCGLEQTVRVYPNFAAVTGFALLAADDRLSHVGVRKKPRRGDGLEFHQLRDYRAGDTLRQVSWPATARMRRLITRDYQDQRDQTVIFLLDCGLRMRSRDGVCSHFDQALNAVLLLSYVALRQGDSVGLATFGGTERWLAPIKGQGKIGQVLNCVFDLEPGPYLPDYTEATRNLLARQRKRALIVIVTGLQDEDGADLLWSARALRQRHLVLVASLREEALDRAGDAAIGSFNDAVRVAAAQSYLMQRADSLERLRRHQVMSLAVLPAQLAFGLVNAYLALKTRGSL